MGKLLTSLVASAIVVSVSVHGQPSQKQAAPETKTEQSAALKDASADNFAGAVFVLDLAGDGWQWTGVDGGVLFDFDGAGKPVRTAWTAAGDDAFLVLDSNGNGVVDSGAELLGRTWRTADGTQVSGTIDSLLLVQGFPLSVGGQLPKPSQFPGVAWIDRDDEVYSRLRAWTDINHNGRSEPNELHSLVDVDADRIYLTFRVIKSEDSLANIVALLGLFADFSYPRPTVDRDMALVRFAR